MKNKIFLSLLSLILAVSIVLVGCAQPASTPAKKTLKIGLVSFLGQSVQLDMKRTLELMAEMDNEKGGLEIGGERYNVEVIAYDSNNNQSTEVAAVNRLVFEDNVKFIMSDGIFIRGWLPVTEANKVLVGSLIPVPQLTLTPDLHYSFHPCSQNSLGSAIIGWFCDNYPDLANDYAMAFPDTQSGHMVSQIIEGSWKNLGLEPTLVFYPENAVDLSALGTKVKTMNPGAFGASAGGATDALVFKAVWQAGYRGQFFVSTGATALSLSQLVPIEALEGFIGAAWAIEFDPAPTQAAQEFKDAWIAKYGEWGGPEMVGTCYYACLKTALQQAGTLDTDKVAEVIYNGMKFEGPTGAAQMVSRPDLGNDRTVDSVTTAYIKQIKGGKPTLLATIGIEEALGYFEKALPPEGAAPPLPPPPPAP